MTISPLQVSAIPAYFQLTNAAITHLTAIFSPTSPYGLSKSQIADYFQGETIHPVQVERDYTSKEDNETFHFYMGLTIIPEQKRRILRLRTALKSDCFLIIAVHEVTPSFLKANSRRAPLIVKMMMNQSQYPPLATEALQQIKSLPIAREQSKIVQQRLKSWEIYIDLLNKNALDNEMTLDYSLITPSRNFRELHVTVPQLGSKIANRKLTRFNATLFLSAEEDGAEKVGSVKRVVSSKNLIVLELEEDYVESMRMNKWFPAPTGLIKLNNIGDLAQARNLRKGFQDLQKGLAQNPNLEYLLFDEHVSIDIDSVTSLVQDTLQSDLNHYQKSAVQGALQSNDLYLIQGPPGTGKTTVIAEICYQNAKRGLRTLVASQSNLAVDNALSKLMQHPSIRILRKGRTNSIEEEGKKYIEENIAHTWKSQTTQLVDKDIEDSKQVIQKHSDAVKIIQRQIEQDENSLRLFDELELMQEKVTDLKMTSARATSQYEGAQALQSRLMKNKKTIKEQIRASEIELDKIQHLLNALDNEEDRLMKLAAYDREERKLNEHLERLQYLEEMKQQIKQLTRQLFDMSEPLQGMIEQQHHLQTLNKNMTIDQLVNHIPELKTAIPRTLYRQEREVQEVRQQIDSASVFSEEQVTQWMSDMRTLQEHLGRQLNKYDISIEDSYELIEPIRITWTDIQYLDLLRNVRTHLINLKPLGAFEKFQLNFFKKYPSSLQECIRYHHELSGHIKGFEQLQNDESTERLREHHQSLQDNLQQNVHAVLEAFRAQHEQRIVTLQEEIYSTKSQLTQLKQMVPEDAADSSIYDIELALLRLSKEKMVLLEVDQNRHLYRQQKEEFEQAQAAFLQRFTQLETSIKEAEQQAVSAQNKHNDCRTAYKELRNQVAVVKRSLRNGETEQKLRSRITQNKTKQAGQEAAVRRISQQMELKRVWNNLLEEAEEYDLEEIRRLYIRHANVIGTTCLQSARRDFIEDYPDFDVVIIDEVSKATPPELLIPMLKGKKIVLVGDHRQLPPLIGEETLEEAVSSLSTLEQQNEAKDILKESLFERLFAALPASNKQTLQIQYRMHESIMQTISPFYKQDAKRGSSGLSCGLKNSDAERDHLLNGQYVRRGQHLMWFDTPHEKAYFETSEAGSTSIFNEEELRIIKGLVLDLEQAVIQAKEQGLMLPAAKKEIGIISFYGEQIRRIKQLIDDEIDTKHLKFRIGTVDRFQGMESDVIIASFVRNNHKGIIGFLKDYRRLNVALSRAKELLLITGNSATLMKQSQNAELFSGLINTVKQQNGMRDHQGRLKE